MDSATIARAELLWNFLRCRDAPPEGKYDLVLVLGGHDESIVRNAAKWYGAGAVPLVVVSGSDAHLPPRAQEAGYSTEASYLSYLLNEEGVPTGAIFEEPLASNTSENFWFASEVLRDHSLPLGSAILVTKPYAERRAFATARRRWPTVRLAVGSDPVEFKQYLTIGIDESRIFAMLVGEVQRLVEYSRIGLIQPQVVPDDVWSAQVDLANEGFDSRALSPRPT